TLSGTTSTYTGTTTINGGTLTVGLLNNLSVASSLGAPTTVANGTIGIGSTTTAATLAYNGGTASTDRVINLAGTTGGATLDATTNASALGAGSLALSGGELELANDTGLNFGRNTTISGAATITIDRLTIGAGVTHTLGTLSLGAQTLTFGVGSNITSGTA